MTLHSLLNVLQQGPQFCTGLLPESQHPSLFAALICGTRVEDADARRLFLDTGLIHIMVVSGAHLRFLEDRVRWMPGWLRLSLLGFYCWCTGFGAPVVKALARRVLETRLRGWTPVQCEAAAVLVCLLFMPSWIFSRSFLMSWMCALAFTLPPLLPVFDRCAKAYVLLFAFCAASPLTILWNALLAPLVGEILFPACLLATALPFLTPVVDGMWALLLLVLEFGPQNPGLGLFAPSEQLFWLPLFAHILFLSWEVRWRRASAFA